jgi:hypothetical protein
MWLLIAEAGIALALLLFIVWWTMSGRSRHGRANPPHKPQALDGPDGRGQEPPTP